MEICASRSDITRLAVDAIVNAANTHLAPGAGVCGAIHDAAGPELAEGTARLGGCPTGDARITPGFRLPAKYVIHAVGPVWHGGGHGEEALLRGAYRASLVHARDHGCTSIAFPAISTGIYGYPLEAATEVAVETMRSFAPEAGGLLVVQFSCFSDRVLDAYRRAGVAAECG